MRYGKRLATGEQFPQGTKDFRNGVDDLVEQRRRQPGGGDTTLADGLAEFGKVGQILGCTTTAPPVDSGPQISSVEASKERGASCKKRVSESRRT